MLSKMLRKLLWSSSKGKISPPKPSNAVKCTMNSDGLCTEWLRTSHHPLCFLYAVPWNAKDQSGRSVGRET